MVELSSSYNLLVKWYIRLFIYYQAYESCSPVCLLSSCDDDEPSDDPLCTVPGLESSSFTFLRESSTELIYQASTSNGTVAYAVQIKEGKLPRATKHRCTSRVVIHINLQSMMAYVSLTE
mgnify:CR=1 FL=1